MRTLPILAMGAAAIVTDACTDQHGNYDSERTRQTMSDLRGCTRIDPLLRLGLRDEPA